METLRGELRLRIDDFGERPDLKNAVWDHFRFLRHYMAGNAVTSFVHAPYFF